ncbi:MULTISPECIES: PAAR domain-containing protein [unclassified Stenotrophomonas]|uniref:PAAR domain-containing protein n=1 Tax=unclassified Stenotrophomonas TaxID=196198 RepID=UPI0021590D0D|nr:MULTISPECIES: PAAR domain-containing protein [unclassified Stenotrophomonas]
MIVLGDRTIGGGEVLTGAPSTFINNIAVARVGETASSPQHGGFFAIVTGDHTFLIDGQPFARHGERLPTAYNHVGGTPGHGGHRGRGEEAGAVSQRVGTTLPFSGLQPSVGSALHHATQRFRQSAGRWS